MSRINNPPDIQAGYLYRPDDHTGVVTAKRADFRPGVNDKLTNMLARSGHPRAAGFVNAVRAFDLGLRRSINTRQLDSARARIEKMGQEAASAGTDEKSVGRRDRLDARVHDLEIKDDRLAAKQELSVAARQGKLDDAVPIANEYQRAALRDRGYTEATGSLSKTGLDREQSQYLVSSVDGHRIRINADRPPCWRGWWRRRSAPRTTVGRVERPPPRAVPRSTRWSGWKRPPGMSRGRPRGGCRTASCWTRGRAPAWRPRPSARPARATCCGRRYRAGAP